MADEPAPPTGPREKAIGRFADALYDVMNERALSIGVLDIGIETNGWYVDGELLFANGPDMGFSVAVLAGECSFCELVGEDSERWIEPSMPDVDVLDVTERDEMREHAVRVLGGVLDARRPLLPKEPRVD